MQNNRITKPHALTRVEKLAHMLLRAQADEEALGFDEVDLATLNQDWKKSGSVMTAGQWEITCRRALAQELGKLTGQVYFPASE